MKFHVFSWNFMKFHVFFMFFHEISCFSMKFGVSSSKNLPFSWNFMKFGCLPPQKLWKLKTWHFVKFREDDTMNRSWTPKTWNFVKFVKFIITIYLKLRIGVLRLLQCILAALFCLGAIETMHPASQDSRKQVRHAREEAWSDCAFPKAFWENSPSEPWVCQEPVPQTLRRNSKACDSHQERGQFRRNQNGNEKGCHGDAEAQGLPKRSWKRK